MNRETVGRIFPKFHEISGLEPNSSLRYTVELNKGNK